MKNTDKIVTIQFGVILNMIIPLGTEFRNEVLREYGVANILIKRNKQSLIDICVRTGRRGKTISVKKNVSFGSVFVSANRLFMLEVIPESDTEVLLQVLEQV